jgi:hypothetical protein
MGLLEVQKWFYGLLEVKQPVNDIRPLELNKRISGQLLPFDAGGPDEKALGARRVHPGTCPDLFCRLFRSVNEKHIRKDLSGLISFC